MELKNKQSISGLLLRSVETKIYTKCTLCFIDYAKAFDCVSHVLWTRWSRFVSRPHYPTGSESIDHGGG